MGIVLNAENAALRVGAIKDEDLAGAFAEAILIARIAGKRHQLLPAHGAVNSVVAGGAALRGFGDDDDIAVGDDGINGAIGGALDVHLFAGEIHLRFVNVNVTRVSDQVRSAVEEKMARRN